MADPGPESAASREFPSSFATPMRDRLLEQVAAASPCCKGKMPLQLPPPPPGMPASQVEKWRKEVAKIVSKQQKEELKLLKQREKEEDKLKREEEKMRAKVEALAKKMQQQAANMRRSLPEVPLTQRWSPEGSPETSPRNDTTDLYSQSEEAENLVEDGKAQHMHEQEQASMLLETASEEAHGDDETNKENSTIPSRVVVSLNAADEVSKVLAARRQRVEQALQATEKHKQEMASLATDGKQRDLACELEKQVLQSFEQRIPNKKKLHELEEKRFIEGEQQREAKELQGKIKISTNLLDELNKKRKSMSEKIEQCTVFNAEVGGAPDADSTLPALVDASEMDYVIDEIPVLQDDTLQKQQPVAPPVEPCGIGIMIALNPAAQYSVISMFPTGPAARSGLLNVNDIIECIDGHSIKGMKPEAVGNMIRGKCGTQVVLDVLSGPQKLCTRVGITRALSSHGQDSRQASCDASHLTVQPDIPVQSRPKVQRTAPPPPALPPAGERELCDYASSCSALTSTEARTNTSAVEACAAGPPPFISGTLFSPQGDANRCGVGLSFEFQPGQCALVLRAIDKSIETPLQVGDCLVEVNGTSVASNSMLAPSLIWGDTGTSVTLKTIRKGEVARTIEATLLRQPSAHDATLITMAGGGKTCGIGVVLEIESTSRCFYVKRLVHGAPAFSAGVLQGDLVTHIDNKDVRSFTKDQLPSLILGPEGSVLHMRLMRAGEPQPREFVITRFLDTAKAQQSNLASSAVLTFDYMESVGSPLDVDQYAKSLKSDIVSALQTVSKRVEVASVSLESGLANVYILADFEGLDTRSVEELVRDFVYQGSNQRSVLRQMATCKSLSKITVLGQVDPMQPKLDLDKWYDVPIVHQARNTNQVDCSMALSESEQEVELVCRRAPVATRAAPPSLAPSESEQELELVCRRASVATCAAPPIDPVDQTPMNTCAGSSEAILSPKVLSVVRAARSIVSDVDKGTEQDSLMVSPLPMRAAEDSCVLDDKVSTQDDALLVSEHGNGAKYNILEETEPNSQNDQIQEKDEKGEDSAQVMPLEHDAKANHVIQEISGAIELPIGRKLLACLGHPEATDNPFGQVSDASSAPESKTTYQLAHDCAQPPDDDEVGQHVEENVAGKHEIQLELAAPCTEEIAASEKTDKFETEKEQTATESLEHASAIVESREIDAGELHVHKTCVTEHQSPSVCADNPAPAVTVRTGELEGRTQAGSALEVVEALDAPIIESKELFNGAIDECNHLIAHEESKVMLENLSMLQAMGSHAAMGCDAWAEEEAAEMLVLASGANIQVCAPPRPSRSGVPPTASASSGPALKPPPRPPRGFDPTQATGASASQPAQSMVSTVTSYCKPTHLYMDLTPEEVQEIHDKFPHRIPVVVAKAELSIAPEIQGNKYLVPANITSRNLQILISRRIEALPTGMRLVLTVAGASLLDGCNKKIGDLVKSHGNSQGILHVMYDVEEGEFSSSHGVDESVQIQGDACYSEDHWVTSRSSSPVKMPAQAQTLKDNSPSLTEQKQLKSWISLDLGPVNTGVGKEESISPLSLLIGLGSNLRQIAMPQAQPHTVTIDEKGDADAVELSLASAKAGVGLRIERDVSGKGFRIAGVAPGGPAALSGICQVNDYLISVDNIVLKDKKTDDAASLLKGEEGSRVQLTLRKADKMHIVTLIRSAVARQGKVKATDRIVKPLAAKNDKVQFFGFSF